LRPLRDRNEYTTRTRYFSTEVAFATTGTVNRAAHAEVFSHRCDAERIRQVPPTGSSTSTVIGAAL
jgi:hypothetical protein